MNKKLKKRIVISATVVFLIVFLFPVLFVWVLGDVRYTKTVKTKFGDKFKVTYDERKAESTVESTNSDMYIYVGDKIDKDDFILLMNSSEFKVYIVESYLIFDDGNGFQRLDEDNIDNNAEIADLARKILLSEIDFFKRYISCFLKSKVYHDEAIAIIESVKEWNVDELYKYGLEESEANDSFYIQSYKQYATDALSEYKKHH